MLKISQNIELMNIIGKGAYGDVYMHGNDSIVLSAATEIMRWKTDYIMPIAQIGEEYMEDLFAPSFTTVINVSSWLNSK